MQIPKSFILWVGVVVIFCSSASVYSQGIQFKPTLVFNREVVHEGQDLQYGCTGSKYDNKTAVSFFSNDVKLFDSTTNKTVSGVTKINATAITLSAAFIGKMGIKNAYCTMNGTSSFVFEAIPYISKISFRLTPKAFKVGTPFNVSCSMTVLPSSLAYNVTFQRNSKDFGMWIKDKKTGSWTWANGTAISGGSVAPGVTPPPPPFSVMVNSTKKDVAGRYRCTAVLPVGLVGKTATFTSDSLSNGSAGVSTFTALVTALMASFFVLIR
ncbi:hypothetical protein TYRP_017032 [Tyrophagus putrescentiae]|nr:hypothetical protein TYRP_017032 [Tyrophagus putrescentiae]